MNTLTITSLCLGLLSGYFYGLSFVAMQKRVFMLSITHKKNFFLPSIRILILSLTLYSLLQSIKTDLTLVFIAFMAAFWIVIYTKVYVHDGTRAD